MFVLLAYESDDDGLNSLKHLYVYILCSYLESLLRLTYGHVFIEGQNRATDRQHKNLAETAAHNLEYLSWNDLLKEDRTYLNVSIPDEIRKGDAYKAVEILFVLRNRLIHGNSFEVGTYEKLHGTEYRDGRVVGRAESVYEYFVRKGLMNMPKHGEGVHFPLSNQVIVHFVGHAFEFVHQYCRFLEEKYPCDSSIEQPIFTTYSDDLSGLLEKCERALNTPFKECY